VGLEDVGTDRVACLARTVLASSQSSAILPTSLARVVSVEPIQTHRGDTRLRITFDVDGRRYWYVWPKDAAVQDALRSAESLPVTDVATVVLDVATIVLANLAELLEAAGLGLQWGLERGLIVVEPRRPY
jgi:hypothetical protein